MLEKLLDSFVNSETLLSKPQCRQPIEKTTYSQIELMQIVHKHFMEDGLKNILRQLKYREKMINLIQDRIYFELFDFMTIDYSTVERAVNEYISTHKI